MELDLLQYFLRETNWEKPVQDNLRKFTMQASQFLGAKPTSTQQISRMLDNLENARRSLMGKPEWSVINSLQHAVRPFQESFSMQTLSSSSFQPLKEFEPIVAKELVTRAVTRIEAGHH